MLRKLLRNLFGLVGIEVHFFRKREICDYICLDRNIMEWFYLNSRERKLYKEAMDKTGMWWSDNFPKQCRHYTLQKLAQKVLHQKLDGDMVECGCWKGTSSYQIAYLIKEAGSNKRLHVFDSFEGGLSEKVGQDRSLRVNQSEDDVKKERDGFASTEDEVRGNLSGFDFVKYYAAWIPERFEDVGDQKFCLVHIDVDLYEPTRQSLEFFYERLVIGGVIVVDDYGYTQFPGAKKAVNEFLDTHPENFFLDSPTGGCFLVKQSA